MDRFLSIKIIIPLSFLFLNCEQKKEKQQAITTVPRPAIAEPISIRFAGEVDFRKSYSGLQFIKNEKEAAREEKIIDKSNPTTGDENESLRKKLERLGFVKDHELLLPRFKYNTSVTNQLKDSSCKFMKIKFNNPATVNDEFWKMTVYRGIDSAFVKIDAHLIDLKYALLDVIPGGNKEIVLLYEWYISNGYNYDFLVYEIKANY